MKILCLPAIRLAHQRYVIEIFDNRAFRIGIHVLPCKSHPRPAAAKIGHKAGVGSPGRPSAAQKALAES